MPNIFTLLNNSDFFKPSYIKDIFEKHDINKKSVFDNVMIKAYFGTSEDIITIDDISIICDGNIYNYVKIYEDLQIVPKTDYDYEVIIHLYKEYGMETTLQIIDGIYAFILIDNRIKDTKDLGATIYLAKDQYGVKPLYILQPNSKHPNYSIIKNKVNNMYTFSSKMEVLEDIKNELNPNYEYGNSYLKANASEKTSRLLSDESSDIPFYIIHNIEPGTYSVFELEYKVLSLWENIKFQIPFHYFIPGTTLNNVFLSNAIIKDLIWKYIEDAYMKRILYYLQKQRKILFIMDYEKEPFEGIVISNVIKNNENISNNIQFLYINDIISEEVSSKNDATYWSTIFKEASSKYSNHVIFLNIGFDKLIKEKENLKELEYRNYCHNYFKNLYLKRIYNITKTNNCGFEIDYPLLDVNFIYFFLTNYVTLDSICSGITIENYVGI